VTQGDAYSLQVATRKRLLKNFTKTSVTLCHPSPCVTRQGYNSPVSLGEAASNVVRPRPHHSRTPLAPPLCQSPFFEARPKRACAHGSLAVVFTPGCVTLMQLDRFTFNRGCFDAAVRDPRRNEVHFGAVPLRSLLYWLGNW
jgi:hypothetical protein